MEQTDLLGPVSQRCPTAGEGGGGISSAEADPGELAHMRHHQVRHLSIASRLLPFIAKLANQLKFLFPETGSRRWEDTTPQIEQTSPSATSRYTWAPAQQTQI